MGPLSTGEWDMASHPCTHRLTLSVSIQYKPSSLSVCSSSLIVENKNLYSDKQSYTLSINPSLPRCLPCSGARQGVQHWQVAGLKADVRAGQSWPFVGKAAQAWRTQKGDICDQSPSKTKSWDLSTPSCLYVELMTQRPRKGKEFV